MMNNTLTEKEEIIVPEKKAKKFFVETYGCQMNVSDSEIVIALLQKDGYESALSAEEADIVLINTCAIRENAEERVRTRIKDFKSAKKHNPGMVIGVLGCMAERLKTQLLEEETLVDLVVGPDAYRSLPGLINNLEAGDKAVNVQLSLKETYSNINPVRFSGNAITAFITIMRGCDNMCSFCVVPFTRGRERSRDPESIVNEAKLLFAQGYREVTLLGQNVDSYKWFGGGPKKAYNPELIADGFKEVNFASLLEMVAMVNPMLRVRFSTSNPQDMTDEVLHVIAKHHNICNYVHLPMQSGSSRVLELMNRGYDREKYIQRINAIRTIIPDCGISTDVIAGFCSETDEEHKETISLMELVKFDYAYMFPYSERPATPAGPRNTKMIFRKDIKLKRMQEILALQRQHSMEGNKSDIGKVFEVLVEGYSKRSKEHVFGRNTQNKAIIFASEKLKPGDYAFVKVTSCTSGTLIGEEVSE